MGSGWAGSTSVFLWIFATRSTMFARPHGPSRNGRSGRSRATIRQRCFRCLPPSESAAQLGNAIVSDLTTHEVTRETPGLEKLFDAVQRMHQLLADLLKEG